MPTALQQAKHLIDIQWQQPNGKSFASGINRNRSLQTLIYGSGVGAKEVDTLFVKQFTLAASGTLSIDLQAGTYSGAGSGSLLDLNNEAITFARVKGVKVKLKSAAGGSTSIKVNGAVSHANSPFHALIHSEGVAGGYEGWAEYWCPSANGKVTTNNSLDILAITELGGLNSATVIVEIIGGAS